MLTKNFIEEVEGMGFDVVVGSYYITIFDGIRRVGSVMSKKPYAMATSEEKFYAIDGRKKDELFLLMYQYAATPIEERELKLSGAERVILENIPKEYEWIARDELDNLYLYDGKPCKSDMHWHDEVPSHIPLTVFNRLFQFIQWENDEPYNTQELLGGK